ncbi:phage portal protein [Lactonifactor sp. BIOML-A3]|uniref:phage portal protein n=1 Tax=unclassified Lactonifactor TaxID=2636670 RepID=UPI0012B140FD|nr:phage portal protein [Lactonifactor sp. BIOML-A5]MSA10274.1 phage portal protein [Lactonifactor sp. BIOML-A4]MSA13562.1 phage portal protein [Lactonifactor sp. BIOML-A3]MSA19247.1 phage portal protein [Lactonifactor sp. BIOML-A2]MSA39116.1 phage portal protein [Lactonifactor sp. BIOML-A1]MSB14781.1 phage portal protein [Lactonifactor sp. BIOML-A6]MSB70222.1 phage portal protein [Lactonifactor sp. BIOML-A7]
MGIIEKLKFWEKPKNSLQYADILNGYTPIYSQFGTDIYAADAVQQAISCIVQEMKKLNPTHVREIGNDVIPVGGGIQKALHNPNEFMTTSDLIEKCMWNYFLNYNSFIYPTYYVYTDKQGKQVVNFTGFYPLQPVQVDFMQDASNILYVKFTFPNSYNVTIPYSRIIHIKRNYSVNEYMGGNEQGQPDHRALIETLNINDNLLKGVAKAMNASMQINGVVKYKTMLDGGKTDKAIQEFETKLKNSQSGFLPLDISAEVAPFDRKLQLVDAETLKFIDEKILRNFGVPLPILTGDYTKSQYEAFYQKTLEPIIISISQAFTKTLFSDMERSYGNKITFYPKDLIFMSVAETLEMVRLLGDSGALYENEKRVAFGLRPLSELEGKRTQSLNYVDVELAAQYQLQQKNTNNNVNQGGKIDNGK